MRLLLCSGNLTNSIIRSITVLSYSLNNIHVGAKLNGEQHIIKFIQNAYENNEKSETFVTVLLARLRKIGLWPSCATRLGPWPSSRWPGRQIGLARCATIALLGRIRPD